MGEFKVFLKNGILMLIYDSLRYIILYYGIL